MTTYSLDLRARIVAAYEAGEGSVRELAERFAVNPSTVQRYLTRRRASGTLTPDAHGGGRSRTIDAEGERVLRQLLRERRDRTDHDYAQRLSERLGRTISRQAVQRTWARMGITRKKKDLHASEQDEPRVQRLRRSYDRYVRQFPAFRRVYVDEFGTNLAMTPQYARSLRGTRARGHAPANPGPNVTLVMGLRDDGIVAPLAFSGSMTAALFEGYVRQMLAPAVHRGDVVIADNLSAHRGREVRTTLVAAGAHFRLLPPYSPDRSPIEEAGAKVKAHLRAEEPRTRHALYDAMGTALRSVTAQDARGWFRHRAHVVRPSSTFRPA